MIPHWVSNDETKLVAQEVKVGWLQNLIGSHSGVGPAEANDLKRDGAVLLDVREMREWKAGHAPGARHIPLREVSRQIDSLPHNRRLVVVCRSGHRSSRATFLLKRSGFNAVSLNGGMLAWVAAGLPLEGSSGAKGRIV